MNLWQFADAHPFISLVAIVASAFTVTFCVSVIGGTVEAFAKRPVLQLAAQPEDEDEDEDDDGPAAGGAEQAS